MTLLLEYESVMHLKLSVLNKFLETADIVLLKLKDVTFSMAKIHTFDANFEIFL